MIPIQDTVRSPSFPVINGLIIGADPVIFLYETTLSPARLNHLIATYGLAPERLHLFDPQWISTLPLDLATIFTSMFLHSGWFHGISSLAGAARHPRTNFWMNIGIYNQVNEYVPAIRGWATGRRLYPAPSPDPSSSHR